LTLGAWKVRMEAMIGEFERDLDVWQRALMSDGRRTRSKPSLPRVRFLERALPKWMQGCEREEDRKEAGSRRQSA
jgi:hypothetical protein